MACRLLRVLDSGFRRNDGFIAGMTCDCPIGCRRELRLNRGNSATVGNPRNRHPQATVVPAKAGIQEIPRKRAGRLLRVLDSGFRRNDGFMMRCKGMDGAEPSYILSPLILSSSKDKASDKGVVRQAHHERVLPLP